MRTAVLASGSGTLLDAILADGIPVELVVVDRPCAATEVAERHGVRAVCHERSSFGADFDRDAYTAEVTRLLVEAGIELVVMAGYGTRSEEHTSELQSLMRISYAVLCLKKK